MRYKEHEAVTLSCILAGIGIYVLTLQHALAFGLPWLGLAPKVVGFWPTFAFGVVWRAVAVGPNFRPAQDDDDKQPRSGTGATFLINSLIGFVLVYWIC